MSKQLKQALFIDAHVCPAWLAGPLENPLRRFIHNPDKIFKGLVEPGQTVIDVGCGPGFFSVALARLVGEHGRVIAVDMQAAMLERVRYRAAREGLETRLQFHQGFIEELDEKEQADLVLAFWMVHEVPNKPAFLQAIRQLLKPGARFLLVEPRVHVSASAFAQTVQLAQAAGFTPMAQPSIKISRAVLFKK